MRLFQITLIVLLIAKSFVLADPGKIAGTVVDEYGDGILGAAVQSVETSQGVGVINVDGSYAILEVEPGTYTVRISAVGYIKDTLYNVTVEPDLAATANIVLMVDPQARHGGFIDCGWRFERQIDSSKGNGHKPEKQKRSWFHSLFRRIF